MPSGCQQKGLGPKERGREKGPQDDYMPRCNPVTYRSPPLPPYTHRQHLLVLIANKPLCQSYTLEWPHKQSNPTRKPLQLCWIYSSRACVQAAAAAIGQQTKQPIWWLSWLHAIYICAVTQGEQQSRSSHAVILHCITEVRMGLDTSDSSSQWARYSLAIT